MCCLPEISVFRWRFASTTANERSQNPRKWKRSPNAGSLIVAWPAGTCGGAWTSRRYDHNESRTFPYNFWLILMPSEQKIRVLVAKPGLDGHDRGAKVIARALRDAGMEVIYTGLRQTPEMIVNASLQEDVAVIGLSILSGAHNAIVPRVMDLLKQHKMDDVLVLVGGIIPEQDIEALKKIGVAAIFQPGTAMDDIVKFIRANVKPRGVPAG